MPPGYRRPVKVRMQGRPALKWYCGPLTRHMAPAGGGTVHRHVLQASQRPWDHVRSPRKVLPPAFEAPMRPSGSLQSYHEPYTVGGWPAQLLHQFCFCSTHMRVAHGRAAAAVRPPDGVSSFPPPQMRCGGGECKPRVAEVHEPLANHRGLAPWPPDLGRGDSPCSNPHLARRPGPHRCLSCRSCCAQGM